MCVSEGDTFRDLLGPDYAQLIDLGDHYLRDARGIFLNIDSELPEVQPDRALELEIVRREVRSLWTDRCPALREIVVVALVGDSKNVGLFRAMTRMLRVEGIAAAGFRDDKALRTALVSEAARGFRCCALLADQEALAPALEIARDGRLKPSGLEVRLGYAFRAGRAPPMEDVVRESLPWTIPVTRLPVSGGQLAVACGRLVTAALYDFENYPHNGGDERERIRVAVLRKYDQWSSRVRSLDGASVDRGMTQFLWRWLTEFGGSGVLEPLTINSLVSEIDELRPFREAIGEGLDLRENPWLFKKAAELLEIQMDWKDLAAA